MRSFIASSRRLGNDGNRVKARDEYKHQPLQSKTD
jgi:hypothetical protein